MNGRAVILVPLCAFVKCPRENICTFIFTFLCFGIVKIATRSDRRKGFCLRTCDDGLGTVQANIRRPLTTECRVRIQASLFGVCDALSGSGGGGGMFSSEDLGFPLSVSLHQFSIVTHASSQLTKQLRTTQAYTVRLVTNLEFGNKM